MARSVWKGYLTFGMVTVPVGFYTATDPQDLSFRTLHKDCGTPIKRQYVCPHHDYHQVRDDELQKAYELGKGNFIPMLEEELAKLPNDAGRLITVERFVDEGQIDPVFYEHTYYLGPEPEGKKPFALLREALTVTNKVALGTVVLRDKENVVVIRPHRKTLAVSTLYYVDEIRPIDFDCGEEVPLSEQEKTMGTALVNALSGQANLAEYKDHYREKVMEIIKAKSEGRAYDLPTTPTAPAKTMDLTAALQASLAAAKAKH